MRIPALAAHPDGSFTICGDIDGTNIFGPGEANQTTLTSVSSHEDAFLAHYNADQTLAWAQAFDVTGTSSFIHAAHCAPRPAGGVVVGGTFIGGSLEIGATTLQSVSTGDGDAWLAAFAVDGTPQWARSYPASSASSLPASSEVDSIVMTSTGDAVIGGAFEYGTLALGTSTLASSTAGRAAFFARVTSDGEVAWAKAITDTYDGATISLRGAGPGPSASFYAAGNFNGSVTFGPGEPDATTFNGISEEIDGTTGFFARFEESDGTLDLARQLVAGRPCFSAAFATAVRPDGVVLVGGQLAGICAFGPDNPNPVTMTSVGSGDLFLSAWFPN